MSLIHKMKEVFCNAKFHYMGRYYRPIQCVVVYDAIDLAKLTNQDVPMELLVPMRANLYGCSLEDLLCRNRGMCQR